MGGHHEALQVLVATFAQLEEECNSEACGRNSNRLSFPSSFFPARSVARLTHHCHSQVLVLHQPSQLSWPTQHHLSHLRWPFGNKLIPPPRSRALTPSGPTRSLLPPCRLSPAADPSPCLRPASSKQKCERRRPGIRAGLHMVMSPFDRPLDYVRS